MLWPEAYSFSDAENDMKSMGPLIFAREMQNERADNESAIIKSDWLKDWEYNPSNLKFDKGHYLTAIYITCDPSIGKKAENDASGFATILLTQRPGQQPVYWIDEIQNERLSMQARIDLLKSMISRAMKWKPPRLEAFIETIAGFKDFGDMCASSLGCAVRCVDRVPDKLTNLERKSFIFQNQRIKLNKNLPDDLKNELKLQLTSNHPHHDDIRDAVLLALEDSVANKDDMFYGLDSESIIELGINPQI